MTTKCPKCQHENPDKATFCADCGTRLQPPKEAEFTKTLETPKKELTTGATFANRYQIIEELGKGGMGRVYKVLDKETKEKVALKLIKSDIAADKKTVERFRNELTSARKISHKNICRMYDLGKEKGSYFITMEFVPGEDLKSFIRRAAPLSTARTLSIARQVCEGLGEAHQLGVVHRDLKPQNIMIDKQGNVRIMDFGIARSVQSKRITGDGVMIGTPDYMSPEQVDGKEVDHRTDIYSLGIILYEMVTGRVPFEGDTPFSIGIKQKSELPKDPKEFNPQLPEELSLLILKCLEKERTKRYQNAGEIRSDLEAIEAGIPSTEKISPQRRPLTSREITVTLGVRKLFIPALLLTAIVLVGLFLWHPWAREKPASLSSEGKPSLAVIYFENNTGDESLDHWRKGISDLLITDLMQSKYLKVLGGDQLVKILTQLDQLETESYSSEVLKKVATQAGVDHIARGSYSKAGNILRIDMVLQDSESGDPIATKKVEGETEAAIFTMVDELTKWTKESLMLSAQQIADDLDEEIGRVTTSSPEAYKFYLEGCDLFAKNQYEQSIESLGKAIAQDPGFAMAYRKIAHAYGNSGKPNESKKYLQKAMELAERLTEKEKLLIQGDYFGYTEVDYNKAIDAYEKLIELYPESDEAISARNNLGILYADIENWDKAIEAYENALNSGRTYRGTYTNLAASYMAIGKYDKAESILKKSIELNPDFIGGHWALARLYAYQGEMKLALEEVDKTAAIDPTYTKGRFYLLQWDFEKARGEYFKWFDHIQQNYHLAARLQLNHLYRTQGKFKEAENQLGLGIEKAEEMHHSYYVAFFNYWLAYLKLRQIEFESALEAAAKSESFSQESNPIDLMYDQELKGWIYAEAGELEKALEVAEELKRMIEEGPYKKRVRHYDFLMGIIQLKKRNYSDSIDFFKNAVSLLPYPARWETDNGPYLYHLALAYYESGDLQRAREKFEELIHLIPGRNSWGDLYAQSYYKLGLIYEKQGDSSKAAQHFEKFLDLWKDADPIFSSEVEDARKRLNRPM